MRRILSGLGVCAFVALSLFVTMATAQDKKEEKLAFDKIPKVVRDAVLGRFPGAQTTSITKETVDGKVVYDIELTQKGRKYEMDIEENGTVIEVEKEMALKDVP